MQFAKGQTECTPAEAGYDESRIETLNNHFKKLVDDSEIIGATYCMARKGKIFAHGAVGYSSYKKEKDRLLQPDAVHYIASMTKTFTGVAIMKLFEDGVLRLDEAVANYLPQFSSPPFNGINLFHLLTHTSGMHADGGCFPNEHNHGGYWDFIEKGYKAHNKADGEFDWIAAALAHGVRDVPGKQWMYCSFGFVLLGEVIRKATGMHPHKYIEDSICKPLGLKDTSFDLTAEMAKRYIIQHERAEKRLADFLKGTEEKTEEDKFWDSMPSTGGGMKSTVYDIVRYGNMVLNKGTFDGARVLGRKAVEKMTSFAVNVPDYCWGAGGGMRGYGIGFDHRNGPQFSFSDETVMHEGAGACALYIDPREELVAAWIAPFAKMDQWYTRAMYSTVNVIWSGLK